MELVQQDQFPHALQLFTWVLEACLHHGQSAQNLHRPQQLLTLPVVILGLHIQ